MTIIEPEISVRSREDLLYLLSEAAEIEHNLMCCYLFAAFSIKTEADGVSAADARMLRAWKRAITGVAVEEMTHLALVSNLTSAVGGAPHFGRPNFPVAPGYHPSGVIVQLRRFDLETLDHFIFLERPEGIDAADAPCFAAQANLAYQRTPTSRRFMPSAQDYLTVGHLYRGLHSGLRRLSETLGEANLFNGEPGLQIGPEHASLPGLSKVDSLATALSALNTIVEQGEGSPADTEHSHYRRFLEVRHQFEARLKADPKFDPARPVAANPVMRNPPDPTGKTFIDEPKTAHAMELANAIYGAMLRALAQGFSETAADRKKLFMDVAIDGMFALIPVAEHLTTMAASPAKPGLTAGMSFAMLRDVAALPASAPSEAIFAERFRELANGTEDVFGATVLSQGVCKTLREIAGKLVGSTKPEAAAAVETAEGKDIVIGFETKRCIHARFCVLQQPGVFKANTPGAWIFPDDATTTEELAATARACPSGAITYVRKDGAAQESPPPVNLIQTRENGPLAFRGDLMINGKPMGFRATLCRCGQSANKPFCDGAHATAGFSATGEPEKGHTTALEKRDGVLDIKPQKNGPLAVSGNMELISGTGCTFRKARNLMLCRCGHSASKPYCDGSHARFGFVS